MKNTRSESHGDKAASESQEWYFTAAYAALPPVLPPQPGAPSPALAVVLLLMWYRSSSRRWIQPKTSSVKKLKARPISHLDLCKFMQHRHYSGRREEYHNSLDFNSSFCWTISLRIQLCYYLVMAWCRLVGCALTLAIHSQYFFCANASICAANHLFSLAWFPALSVLQGTPKGLCQHKDGQEHTAKRKQKPELQPSSGDYGKTPKGRFGKLGRFSSLFTQTEVCTAASWSSLSTTTLSAPGFIFPRILWDSTSVHEAVCMNSANTESLTLITVFWLDQHRPRKRPSKVRLFPSGGNTPRSAHTDH